MSELKRQHQNKILYTQFENLISTKRRGKFIVFMLYNNIMLFEFNLFKFIFHEFNF